MPHYNASDSREFALRPGREAPRRSLEGMQVSPETDKIIVTWNLDGKEEPDTIKDFLAGDLLTALYQSGAGASGGTSTVVVLRNGVEVFREGDIPDLFGVVYF